MPHSLDQAYPIFFKVRTTERATFGIYIDTADRVYMYSIVSF